MGGPGKDGIGLIARKSWEENGSELGGREMAGQYLLDGGVVKRLTILTISFFSAKPSLPRFQAPNLPPRHRRRHGLRLVPARQGHPRGEVSKLPNPIPRLSNETTRTKTIVLTWNEPKNQRVCP